MKIKEKVLKEKVLKEITERKPLLVMQTHRTAREGVEKAIDLTLAEVGKILKEIPYSVILRLREGNYIEDAEVDGCKEKVLMYIIEEELKQKLNIK